MIVADKISRARHAATLAGQHGGNGVVDVNQVEPGIGVAFWKLARAQRLDPGDDSSRTVDPRQTKYVGLRNFFMQQAFGIETDLPIRRFGLALGRLIDPFSQILVVDAGA